MTTAAMTKNARTRRYRPTSRFRCGRSSASTAISKCRPIPKHPHVPDVDPAYRFDRDTTLAILAGFAHNRRVMIQAITAPANRPISNRSRRG